MRNFHQGHHCHLYHLQNDEQQCHDKLIPELAGAIFMCNNETRMECFRHRIMGLPACREHFVRQVKDGMFLFLFDTDDRKMFGVFKATSDGDMNIVPEAYRSTGSTIPAQVQFEIVSRCKPLTEPEFKSAILRNYFTDMKFSFGLNFDQVHRLLNLFEDKKVGGVPQSISDRLDPSSSVLPVKRCYAYQQCDSMSNTDGSSQTVHKHIRNTNPNTEAAQQKAQVVYSTGTCNCPECAQKFVPGMAYNSCLIWQTPCGTRVNPDDQVVTLSDHNHLNLSPSQASECYAPYHSYPENIKKTVCTCSDLCGGSRLQDRVNNSRSQDVEQKKSVFLRLSQNPQRKTWETESSRICASSDMDQPSHHMQQICRQTSRRAARRPSPFYSKPDLQYQERVCTNGLTGGYTDAAPDTAMEVDGIDLDLTAPFVEHSETQIPFVNFNRRIKVRNLGTEPQGGNNKKRKLIRPPLELKDSSHLQVLEGPLQAAIDLNEPLNNPSLVSTESALDGKSMLTTDKIHVDARVDSKDLELMWGSVCKSMGSEVEVVDTPLEEVQGNHEGEKDLFNGLGIEIERGCPDLGTSIRDGSLVTALDQQRDESNKLLVSIERESMKLKLDLKESKDCPFTSDNICLDELTEISKVETKSDGPQMMIPISLPEKSDTSKFNESFANLSDDQTELLVIEKSNKKKPVINPELIQLNPMTQIKDNSILEHEPVNPTVSLCLYDEESNLVEACINIDPKANNLEADLISRVGICNTVEDYIALDPEADLETFMFSFSRNSIPVEDYITLE